MSPARVRFSQLFVVRFRVSAPGRIEAFRGERGTMSSPGATVEALRSVPFAVAKHDPSATQSAWASHVRFAMTHFTMLLLAGASVQLGPGRGR